MPPIFSVREMPCDCMIIETRKSLLLSNGIQCLSTCFQLNMFTTELLILLQEPTPSAALLISTGGNPVFLGVEVPAMKPFCPLAFFHASPHLIHQTPLLASPSTHTQNSTTPYHLNNFGSLSSLISLQDYYSHLLISVPASSPAFP